MLSLATDTGRRSASHRFASVLNRFSLSTLRRGLATVLLGLPLLAALTSEAAAQSANADGTYTVPQDWALKPSSIGAGESFRLLFISSTTRNATALDTSDYDNHVRNRVAAGHTAIRPYSATFRALYSTTAVHARDHAMTTGTGVPIYWLGGARVADNYPDFHDGSWNSAAGRNQNGASQTGTAYTGSRDNGTAFPDRAFSPSGQTLATQIRYGSPADGLDSANSESNVNRSYFGLSPIFVVAQNASVITIAAGTSPVTEGATASFTITATPAPSAALTVSLFVADASGSRDFVASTNEGTQTVTVPTSGSAIYSVPTVADTTSEGNGPVTVTVIGTAAYIVSPSQNSASVQVNDDDAAHVLSVSTDDPTMEAEGDSGLSDGATLTFTIDPPGATGFVTLNVTGSVGVSQNIATSDFLIVTSESPTVSSYFIGRTTINLETFFSSGPSRTLRVRASGDTSDEGDETVQITLQRIGGATPASVIIDPDANRVTYTIIDDDPTIVSLTRTGGTGAIEEGGTVGFTIELDRALTAGEIIDVPLSIGGTGVTADDWSLAAAGTGVTLSAEDTATPLLNFAGAGAETATLVLTTTLDDTDEGGGTETYTIALGPNDASANGFDLASRATNVGGGADPHASDNTFDVMVGDATVHTLSINLDRTMAAEGDSSITDGATVTITIDPPYTGSFVFNICLRGTATRGDSADWRYTRTNNSPEPVSNITECESASDVVTNFASLQRKIRINGDTVDELDETVTLTLQRNSRTPVNFFISPTAGSVTYTITDDDPTVVSLTRTGGTGAIEEGGTVGFTIELDRALTAGEIIDVPLSIGGTGVTAGDWSLAAAGTGVTLSAEATATPLLNFAGAGAETATLVLTTTLDDTAEGGGTETYTIALGPNDNSANGFDLASRATNVGGGADPHASDTTFDVMVTDVAVHTVSISLDRTMAAEGDSGITDGATVTVTFDPPYTGTYIFAICSGGTATRGDSADWRYTGVSNRSLPFESDPECGTVIDTATSLASYQRKIRINGDTVDEPDETVTLTLQRVSVSLGSTSSDIVLDSDVATFTIIDDDTAGVTITETDDATTLTEGGTDDYGVMLATQPTANVTITPTSGTTATATVNPTALTFTATNWDTVQTITVSGEDNNADAANQEVTITHAINSTGDALYNALAPVSVTATVTDDDATTVTLAGTAGNVMEGAAKQITVTLSRALAEGEALPVPLTFMGEATPGTDYSVTGAMAQGVAYTGLDSATGMVTFTGPSATSATLTLSATPDSDVEASGETVIIGLGTLDGDSGTGLDGGASGTDSLDDFSIEDPLLISITGGTAVTEGSSATFTVTANRVPSSALMIDLTVADAATGDYLDSGDEGDNMVTLSGATTATVEIPTQADSTDETNGTITVTIADGTGYTVGMSSSAMVGVTDDDATTVTLTGTAGNISEGVTRNLMVTLDRALVAGESLAVPLTLGGNATRGTDYTLTGIPADNIAYDIPNSATAGMVTFTGPAAATATLALAVQVDGMSDTGETITIALGTLDSNSGSGLGGGAAGTGSLAFTIMEQPTIVLPPTLTVTEGASVGYPVSLATAPTAAVTVTVTGHSGTDLTPDETSLTFTMTDWDTVQTVMVAAAEDDADAADDTVTLMHTASGTTAYSGVTGAVVVTIDDNDLPVASFAVASFTTNEGSGTYNVVVNLTPAPAAATTITYTVDSASTATPGTDYTTLTGTVVASVDASSVNISVAITDDSVDETSETVILNLAAGSGYTVGTDRVHTLTIADNDTAGVTVSEAGITVAEPDGTDIYTLVLDTQPAGDVEITVESDTPGAATVSAASLTFTASNWDTVQTVTVTGVNDNVGGNRPATISHSIDSGDGDGAGYPDGLAIATVAVTVTDDDEPVASFAVASFTTNEGSGTYNVVVNLTPVPTANTTISYTVAGTSTATMSADYAALTGTVVASASASSVEIPVAITDDSTQEGSETVILILGTGTGYTVGTGRVHTLTITDDDDAAPVGTGAMQEMQAAQEAWLPRFGLTAVEHMLGGLDYRLSVADQPGLSGNVSGLSAGRALHGGGNATGTGYAAGGFGQSDGGDGLGAGSVDRLLNLSRTLSLRDMLRGSRFVHRGGENGVSVWGQASYSRYEDGQDGVTVDGEVATGLLGVDSDNGRTLLGLALSYSEGTGDWSGASAQGELSSTLASLLPYIRHNVTERLQLWAAASYGLGNLEQSSTSADSRHDINQLSASAGVRGTLLERPLEEGGLTLTLISDAALARIESDDAGGMSGLTANTKRFRMGLEWSWQLPQADGGRLIPELELGMRYDGGDTSDGLGVELGGGISWQLPSKGLTIDLRGRRLLDHEADERREWGVSGSLRYDRQPGSAHGPSLSLHQEYGTAPASGGLDRLLSDSLSDALEEDSSQPGPASGRWSLEGEWGLALNDGATGIPYAGLSSSDAGHDLTLGWRLLSAPGTLDTELDIKALRRRDGEGKTNHGIGAQWKLRW